MARAPLPQTTHRKSAAVAHDNSGGHEEINAVVAINAWQEHTCRTQQRAIVPSPSRRQRTRWRLPLSALEATEDHNFKPDNLEALTNMCLHVSQSPHGTVIQMTAPRVELGLSRPNATS